MKSISFVKNVFRDYYERDDSLNCSVSMIDRREFGFISFENRMIRHKFFGSMKELKSFLGDFVPQDAYFSCAYYEIPEAEMEEKGWLGADLIFDIDADHIPTNCDKVHDEWACGNCGFAGKGLAPENCPVCGSEKFNLSTWPCEACLASAKEETAKLLDMLMQDFGLSENEVHVFFSGHRGYHVHVESEAVKTLDAVARKEIADYVLGFGLDVMFHGSSNKNWRGMRSSPIPSLYDFGWGRRLNLGMQNLILKANEEDLIRTGLRRSVVKAIMQNKDALLKSWLSSGKWNVVRGVGFEAWRTIAEHSLRLQSAKIDTVVTTDIHRLIRLTNTLHGKTGFKKVEFPVSAIGDFDPFKSAVAFKKGTVTVFVFDAPRFRLGDEYFGPYKNQRVELPTAAALLLICKGKAEVLE